MGRWYRRQPVAWRRLGYPRRPRWTARWGPPALQLLGNTQPQRPAVGLRLGAEGAIDGHHSRPRAPAQGVEGEQASSVFQSIRLVSSICSTLKGQKSLFAVHHTFAHAGPCRGREACPWPSHTRHGTRDGRCGVPGVGVSAVQCPPSHGACAVAHVCGTPLTSGACAMASGPWDPGAPSPDISCMPCLYADTTCSIWFSRRSLAPGCGRTCPRLGKHRGHSATYVMLKLIFIMLLRGPAVKSSGGPSLPARPGIPA